MKLHAIKELRVNVSAVCLLLLFHTFGWAAPGDLDTSFDTDGIVITDLQGNSTTDTTEAVAVQPDGKILVAGTSGTNKFAVARYLTTGSLDSGFGNNGVTITPLPGLGGMAYSMALQTDGKILLSGIGDGGKFALVRYLDDGTLDTGFDTDGIVTAPMGTSQATANAMALQADDKIVLVGYADIGGGNLDFAVARFKDDGSLDATFGSGGKVTTALVASVQDYAYAVAVQPDGKIVVAGHTNSGKFGVVRYNTDGSLDTGFGVNGIVVTAVGTIDAYAYAIALQPDGKIVVVGNALVGVGTRGLAVVRYNADGGLDNSFGTAGKVITSLAGFGLEEAEAVIVQPNGKIVIAGEYVSSQSPNDLDLAILRYNSNGGLDTSFDTDGKVTLDLGSLSDFGNGLAVQPDGKILVAGSDSADFVLLRYEGFNLGVTPDSYTFTDETEVAQSQVQTSNLVTVSGLSSGVVVPVSVSTGEYALNGSTTYTSLINWVGNGDQINVRHTSAVGYNNTVGTILSLGGVMAPNGITHLGTGETVKDTYDTTTAAAPAPIAPTGLGATATSSSSISLIWSDNSVDETNFVVQRSIISGSGFATIVTLGANITSYTDTGLSASATYYYQVYATNGADSGFSNEVSATTVAASGGGGGGAMSWMVLIGLSVLASWRLNRYGQSANR